MNKILVVGTSAVFLLYGIAFLFFPAEILYIVVDGEMTSSSGLTDVRATYGGMSVAVGAILFLLGSNEVTERLGVISVCLLMVGMASGRSLGMIIDGSPNNYMFIYLALELLVVGVSLAVLKSNQSKDQSN